MKYLKYTFILFFAFFLDLRTNAQLIEQITEEVHVGAKSRAQLFLVFMESGTQRDTRPWLVHLDGYSPSTRNHVRNIINSTRNKRAPIASFDDIYQLAEEIFGKYSKEEVPNVALETQFTLDKREATAHITFYRGGKIELTVKLETGVEAFFFREKKENNSSLVGITFSRDLPQKNYSLTLAKLLVNKKGCVFIYYEKNTFDLFGQTGPLEYVIQPEMIHTRGPRSDYDLIDASFRFDYSKIEK